MTMTDNNDDDDDNNNGTIKYKPFIMENVLQP